MRVFDCSPKPDTSHTNPNRVRIYLNPKELQNLLAYVSQLPLDTTLELVSTPTGIGEHLTVKSGHGDEKDITDYRSW